MIFDIHVHMLEMHRHVATDRFILDKRGLFPRYLLRRVGLGKDILRQPQANERIQEKLLDLVSHSSIDHAVVLAMDDAYDEQGRLANAKRQLIASNDCVARFANANESILFGASIHPYRKDALEELQRVASYGACLVKWIPSAQHIRLDDPLCTPFYDLLAELRMPLLVHTGNEHVCSKARNDWNDPELLRHPLNRGVTVIAAHCGARMFLHERCRFKTFCRMTLEHERLYGDISAFGIPTRIRALRKLQENDDLMAKVLYGSDFPMMTMERWFAFSIGTKAVGEILRETNPLEKAYLLMKKMSLPDTVFTRAEKILRFSGDGERFE
ncbi:MAG: amidohydrolase family protein [Planctomycetia bacterium]|jgi:predicted TIM-barrel fold metal-dependent hydrolase